MFKCPTDLLSSVYPPAIVDQWLTAFIMEVRKADGGYYTPDSLNCVLAGLQREMRTHLGRAAPNIIDRKSDLFPKKRNALDNQCRMLRSKGIGVVKKRAPAILPHVEKRLWDEGVLSVKTPEGLLKAVYYSNGKTFVSEEFKNSIASGLHSLFDVQTPIATPMLNMGLKTIQVG